MRSIETDEGSLPNPSPRFATRDSRFAPPDLPPDTQSHILDLFIAGHTDLATIAAMNNITFTQLIDFLESPRIVARLDAIQRLCERRAAILAAEARCVALARLRTIAEHQPEAGFTPPKLFTRELETTRKAAAQLLRVPPTCPQVGAQPAPSPPTPPTKPVRQQPPGCHALTESPRQGVPMARLPQPSPLGGEGGSMRSIETDEGSVSPPMRDFATRDSRPQKQQGRTANGAPLCVRLCSTSPRADYS